MTNISIANNGKRAASGNLVYYNKSKKFITLGGFDPFILVWDIILGKLLIKILIESPIRAISFDAEGKILFLTQNNSSSIHIYTNNVEGKLNLYAEFMV